MGDSEDTLCNVLKAMVSMRDKDIVPQDRLHALLDVFISLGKDEIR